MDINRDLLEQKNQEFSLRLASASKDERPALLEKLNTLTSLQRSYEKLCDQFEALFAATEPFVEIEVTNGAVSQNYLNLKKALDAGLVVAERPVTISFPGLQLEACTGDIKTNGYLRDRGIARRFFAMADIPNSGRTIRFSKAGADEYTIESTAPVRIAKPDASMMAGRTPPFRFSQCSIGIGETIVYVDDPAIVCTVHDDKHVLYKDQIYSLSALAQKLRNTSAMLQGPRYFTYHGELLSERRRRLARRV